MDDRAPAIDKIAFTGSTATGRRVMASGAATLKHLTLGLGGNDAAIVLPDVDVARVANELSWAGFRNSGQMCIGTKRIHIHADIYEPLSRAIMRRHIVRAIELSFALLELGEGPAGLFCHGFPDTAETCVGQLRAVAAAGYRAIALNMRGYGSSAAPADPALYTSLHISGDLIGVLDAVDIRSAVLVGHDWGAEHV